MRHGSLRFLQPRVNVEIREERPLRKRGMTSRDASLRPRAHALQMTLRSVNACA